MSLAHVTPQQVTFRQSVRGDTSFRYPVSVPTAEQVSLPPPPGLRFVSGSPSDAAYLEMRRTVDEHIAGGIDPGVWPDSEIDAFFEDASHQS